jgi:hypothetical protein
MVYLLNFRREDLFWTLLQLLHVREIAEAWNTKGKRENKEKSVLIQILPWIR